MSEWSDPILNTALPDGQIEAAAARLPAVRPVVGAWLSYDEAYPAQMALRRRLLVRCENDVYAQTTEGLNAAQEGLSYMLGALPDGFSVDGDFVSCPDGEVVKLNWNKPLFSLGHIVQQDVCILERRGGEHVLTGAVLCFPASWTLAQKIGKPLIGIHKPVNEYTDQIATRVQRLFDGVQEGKPLWRANALRYDDAALYQPRTENDPRPVGRPDAPFLRSERQTIVRIPQSGAVAFVIHTSVVKVAGPNGITDHTGV